MDYHYYILVFVSFDLIVFVSIFFFLILLAFLILLLIFFFSHNNLLQYQIILFHVLVLFFLILPKVYIQAYPVSEHVSKFVFCYYLRPKIDYLHQVLLNQHYYRGVDFLTFLIYILCFLIIYQLVLDFSFLIN